MTMMCIESTTFIWNLTFLPIFFWATTLFADSYGPYADFRQVDPTGRYYVVVKKLPGWGDDPGRGGRVRFDFVKTKPGTEPVTFEQNYFDRDKVHYLNFLNPNEKKNPKVKVREGDTLLGQGILNRAPGNILISSTGQGFVTLDVFGYNFADRKNLDSLVVVSKDGVVQHRKSLYDLYSVKEISQFNFTAGGVFWVEGGWIDEQQGSAVVISVITDTDHPSRIIRVVDLDSGEVSKGSSDEIVTALKKGIPRAMPFAIELAIELRMKNCTPYLANIYSSEEFGDDIRTYAAVGLALFGEMGSKEFLRESVTTQSTDSTRNSVKFAINHLNEIFGSDAPQLLREIACKTDNYVSHQFMKTPSKSIPILIEMIEDRKCPDGQLVAVHCLGRFGTEKAIPSLVKVFQKESNSSSRLKQYSAVALGEIGPASQAVLPHLQSIVEELEEELEKVDSKHQDKSYFSISSELQFELGQYREAIMKIESRK
ncbi:HEAT repeat domain-containing protein [Thalassoglobus polymorphus]